MAAWTVEQKNEFRKEHAVIMPEHQVNHNLPHADVKKYFDTIFATDSPEYKGMVTVAGLYKNASAPQIVAVVPVDKLGDWASEMYVSTRMNYYYGKAQHHGNATWGTDSVFAYNTIGVDIDDHSGAAHENSQNIIDMVIYALADKNIPEPNIIENSGRGYHLVWLLEQMPACFEGMVRKVASYYAKSVKSLLNEYGISNYTVDNGHSSNIAGLTRIPGTFNTKSGTYATYELLHSVRVDLPKAYETIPTQKRPAYSAKRSGHGWAQRRLDALLRYAKLNPSMHEKRDKFCLIFFYGSGNWYEQR